MIEQAFGSSAPWSLGVEEEMLILDAETLALTPAVEALLEAAEGRELPGVLKMELLASMVELATGVCATAQDALAALRELRAAAGEGARAAGLRIAAAGTHPFSLPQAQDVAPDPRYHEFVEYAGISARRQAVCGLHVHVGMPGPDECMRALEGVLPWLPLVLALSANSPYLAGEETGLASARAEVLALLPRAVAPPAFASYAEWEAFVERFVRIGLADGYTRFWWDIRPHPRFGTLEVRAPDQPTSVELTARPRGAPAGAVRDRARRRAAAAGEPRRLRAEPLGRAALRAARGADPPRRRAARPAPELAHELLALVEPAVHELGTRGRARASSTRAAARATASSRSAARAGLEAVAADARRADATIG